MLNTGITRRGMLQGTAALAALAMTSQPTVAAPAAATVPREIIWDCHGHISGLAGTVEQAVDRLLMYADRMGVERMVVCMGMRTVQDPSPEELRQQNDEVLRAVAHAPDRLFGFVFLSAKQPEASLRELDRCVRDGPMVGVKCWLAAVCTEPRLEPVVRRIAELKVPILHHTFFRYGGPWPGESTPADVAALAARHPDVSFLCGHAGADWELGIRAVRATPNVAIDIGGFEPRPGWVEMGVRELGPERVLFGSDFPGRSFASQLAKVHSADLSPEVRRLILGANLKRLLTPALAAKGVKT
jgi:predicted TIM-barrel fold metal-dependent hydrolase